MTQDPGAQGAGSRGAATQDAGIDPTVGPSGPGCLDCTQADPPGWWFHLRRCAQCGHIGCCDTSPDQHASAHAAATGHPIVQSFEPGEDWFWNYRTNQYAYGPALAEPTSHPADQTVPGPVERVPPDWRSHLN